MEYNVYAKMDGLVFFCRCNVLLIHKMFIVSNYILKIWLLC